MMHGRSFGVLVALCATVTLGAPPLAGLYRVGGLGQFQFVTDADGHVKGTFVAGNTCAFAPGLEVVTGDLEGSVLVGRLTTCVEGPPSCGSMTVLPFLATISEGAYTAFLSGPSECKTPGLDGSFTLAPTHKTRLEIGKLLMKTQEWDWAISFLRRAVGPSDGTLSAVDEYEAVYLLGATLNIKRKFEEARPYLERAARNPQGAAERRAEALFNLACAEAQLSAGGAKLEAQAIEHLREAIKLARPGSLREVLEKDADLEPLRALPDFRKLLDLGRRGGK